MLTGSYLRRSNHLRIPLPSMKTLFAQMMAWVPWTSFDRIVERYEGNRGVRSFPCTEQFRAMALDSTTIDLCLSLFDWAPFRST